MAEWGVKPTKLRGKLKVDLKSDGWSVDHPALFISLIHKGVQYNATDEIAFFKNKKKQKKSKDILTCD